jgi:hypothetical protein
MPKKRFSAEQIVTLLRQIEVSIAQGNRSSKIMRRFLRKIAEDEFGNLGDTTTLAEPAVVDDLVNNRQNKKA